MYCFIAAFGFENTYEHQNHIAKYVDIFFFCIFTIAIFINFLTEFKLDGETVPCRDLNKIVFRYLKSNFLIDLIAWVPIHFFINDYNGEMSKISQWAHLIKCVRIYDGIKLMNVSRIMK